MIRVRTDIAKLAGPWSDTMLWYARAVGQLRTRPFDDTTSWTYLGAIHGFDFAGWTDQNIIPNPPPNPPEWQRTFNQCQHAGWFFLPWHRGYLHAFEAILGDWIESQGGPSDWALPYWNYLDASNPTARDYPPEFTDATFDGGQPNPLSDAQRGPATSLGPQAWSPDDISLAAQSETLYTSDPGTLGYGGPISGFAQTGNAFGGNESNPHNRVHTMVGGPPGQNQGWMWDPNFAALDPIFWVHHCNVDRLWAAWLTSAANTQETGRPWGNGPFPRQFSMPEPSGSLSVFIPSDTLPGAPLEPVYDDLLNGTDITPPAGGGLAMVSNISSRPGPSRMIGVNDQSLEVEATPVRSRLAISETNTAAPTGAFAMSGSSKRVFLNVEGVKGEAASGILIVTLTPPDGNPEDAGAEDTKTLIFFGLANATSTQGPHGGSGLTEVVDITEIATRLAGDGAVAALDTHISQPESAAIGTITVDRISLFVREEN